MVDVFKTNVQAEEEARRLVELLLEQFPDSDINFDLEDCDKILRVKHQGHNATAITPSLLHIHGFACDELLD